jgi:ribosomal protein S28E/S33
MSRSGAWYSVIRFLLFYTGVRGGVYSVAIRILQAANPYMIAVKSPLR